jgi:hypothetical protein
MYILHIHYVLHCTYIMYYIAHTYITLYIHTYTMEFHSAIKEHQIISFAGKWLELEIMMLSEIS